ncbi:MAG: hypothetical protein RI967_2151, partial [Planctomycetota bacterium]
MITAPGIAGMRERSRAESIASASDSPPPTVIAAAPAAIARRTV